MRDDIQKILRERNILFHKNEGILIAKVIDSEAGMLFANDLLTHIVDAKTLLLLSGGKTPWDLYTTFTAEEKIQPGAVCLVDERYGKKYHETSNEKKLKETGFLRYLEMRGIPFYPILAKGETREEAAEDYDLMLRELQNVYQASVGILGIGLDGHTAGVAGNRRDFKNALFAAERKNLLVSEFHDHTGMFKERITMTFLGLSRLDLLLVLVFGEDKKAALDLVFSAGPEEEIPGRFYKRPEIAKKTLLITDQYI
jgi:6-phosphogluconolactonase/glucosamine-6-phosphate isomerase/deaminase